MATRTKVVTLVANVVTTVTLTKEWPQVEVLVLSPSAASDPTWVNMVGVDPVLAADDTDLVGGYGGASEIFANRGVSDSSTVIKLRSAGTPTLYVRGKS